MTNTKIFFDANPKKYRRLFGAKMQADNTYCPHTGQKLYAQLTLSYRVLG